jgi:serine/threonine-protein kinase Chk2
LNIKLGDFGLAKIIGEESFTTTLCGTPSYVAPEILADNRNRKYTKAVDVWSLGVVLYICLCGFPPFSDELRTADFPYSLKDQIQKGLFDYPSPYWDPIGDSARESFPPSFFLTPCKILFPLLTNHLVELIDCMLVVNPDKRFTIDQCLAHPWMTQKSPGVNDSTNGLVNGLAGLEMSRRGVTRERTLIADMNRALMTNRIPGGSNKPDVKLNSKNLARETRPADNRDPDEFVAMGGKGDQELYSEDGDGPYSKDDIVGKAAGATGKGKKGGR